MVWAAPTLDYPMEGWDRVFDLNVRGLFYLSQQVARGMRERGGGNIINIASISAWRCATDDAEPVVAYNASKGAVISLTRDLAVKLAADNIRVNAYRAGALPYRHDESCAPRRGKTPGVRKRYPPGALRRRGRYQGRDRLSWRVRPAPS